MYRFAIEHLQKWKVKKHRKPLIIRGARQVGKTWLMREFGAVSYEHVVYWDIRATNRLYNEVEKGVK